MKNLFFFVLVVWAVACTSPDTVLPSQTGRWLFTEHSQTVHTDLLGVKDTATNTVSGLMIFRENGSFSRIVASDTSTYSWAYNNTAQQMIVTDNLLSTKIYKVVLTEGNSEKWKYEQTFELGINETNVVTETVELNRQK